MHNAKDLGPGLHSLHLHYLHIQWWEKKFRIRMTLQDYSIFIFCFEYILCYLLTVIPTMLRTDVLKVSRI